jgi:riboflavin transporter FmnP
VHTKTGAVISLIAGSIAMTVVMTFANYFVLLPLWGISQAEILPLVVSAVIPFNLAKAIISSVATFVVYKRVHYWLEKQIFVKSSKVKG